jgi:sigma-B regulation protein RsbU (phosphoserine phosphatase)
MSAVIPSRVLVCAEREAGVQDVYQSLAQAGCQVGFHGLAGPEPAQLAVDIIVIDGSGCEERALEICGQCKTRLAERFVPILFIAASASRTARTASLERGAECCLVRPLADGELLAQARALLRVKRQHDRLAETSSEVQRVHQRLQQAYQDIDQELQLARRVQQSLLPQTLPELPGVRFAVHYRPCGRVGGDFYDAFRLDENHVGFYVADVMGHGVPASLLTMFLKKAVKPKEISGREYRLLPPEQVLEHLNREMIEQALAENPFITMVYGLLDCPNGTLTFARAGHPHPLYVPRRGEPELWEAFGSLLGVFETQFTGETRHLKPGDKFLLYTDGLEGTAEPDNPQATQRLIECAMQHRKLPIDAFVAQVSRDLLNQVTPLDDLTLLGVEMIEQEVKQ